MADAVIRAEGLSKQYLIGEARHRHDTLRDRLAEGIGTLLGRDVRRDSRPRTIWALRDVSFEVRRGEVVGVVGRNGAGKSTLLKILSRITEPTLGHAEIHGRVASLLEVGTGFHQELTGRENIYLNGSVLGMKRAEIDRVRDEIVAFAGVERFIDTPVKRYSSGMYLRLAFAVAAHLRPEILLVDEVLAVGDAEFQRKCLGKMGEVAREGRTVLFVSHNLGAITRLCGRALWIEDGRLALDGEATDAVASYLASAPKMGTYRLDAAEDAGDGAKLRFTSVRVLSAQGEPAAVVEFTSGFKIEMGYEVRAPLRDLSIICRVTDAMGNHIWTSWDTDTVAPGSGLVRAPGLYMSACVIPPCLLRPGAYYVLIAAYAPEEALPSHDNALTFEVSEVGYRLNSGRHGIITPLLRWETRQAGSGPGGSATPPPAGDGAHAASGTRVW
jgi:lipopolysaccharide transport system ATP-binding protein